MAETIDHNVTLDGYRATPPRLMLGTAGSHGIERVCFGLSGQWDGCAVTAAFTSRGETTTMVVNSEGWCAVPPEATAKPTAHGKLVVSGIRDGACIISCDIDFRVAPHAASSGDVSDATPSEYEQWLAETKDWVEERLDRFTADNVDVTAATDSEIAGIFGGDPGVERHFVDVPRLSAFKGLQDAANAEEYATEGIDPAKINAYFA